MQRFYKRYLINMLVGFPLALTCAIGLVMATGAEGAASALIGLLVGVLLLAISALLAARNHE